MVRWIAHKMAWPALATPLLISCCAPFNGRDGRRQRRAWCANRLFRL